ncbi:MAG: hypothetical protein CBB71_18500 [Rhodopirellula sp. TMED11]|nr:MAG: hypothetical protein CBB71_18500 [Rhodopirellula sp. TMED11]
MLTMQIHRHARRLVAGLTILILAQCLSETQGEAPVELISQRCLDCHTGDEAEAGIDLESLLEQTTALDVNNHQLVEKWVKVEAAILDQRMPPEGEDPLSENERELVQDWFHRQFVLKNGQPHIGPTPLRRLTHYEFINTVEDLLGVQLRADYNILTSVNVEKSFVEKILPLEVPGESGFVNDAHALASQPFAIQQYIRCIDFALSRVKEDGNSLQRLFGLDRLPDQLSDQQLRQIAKHFLHRALRGQATDEHVKQAMAVYTQAIAAGTDQQSALKAMMRTGLLLPEFYYRLESNEAKSTPYEIGDHEFATRLAYFLTSSTPDDQLLDAADAGTLRSPAVLEQQIVRLLNHPRRIALAERFAAQWIEFDELINDSQSGSNGISTTSRAQYDEMLYFFDELFRSNRSVLDIVDSDWTYISHYNMGQYGKDQFKSRQPFDQGMADVLAHRRLTGAQRRGIESIYDPPTLQTVTGDRYGGVITSAAVMRLTSAPARTSPVRRGVWLLDKILGDKLEAPENVPPIDQAIGSLPKANPSKLEILKAHTEMESCMVCHKTIDPLGIGLENFDPTGRWRTEYRDQQPVVSTGVLPGGNEFSSPRELKSQLLEIYQEQIVRNFIRRLLSYAIGRSLKPYDRVTVDHLYERVVEADFKSGAVIREIVASPQFQSRQDKER